MTIRVMNSRQEESLRRKHVLSPLDWGDMAGTDYWFVPGSSMTGATTFLLSSRGWTTTSMALTGGSGADFMSAADKGTPRTALTNATGDLLQSPALFGDYNHARIAQIIMGENILPRFLICDMFAAFTVASADEDQTAMGLFEDDGTISTALDQLAAIHSDGTNFTLKGSADEDVGAAIDNAYHWWRIQIDRSISAVTDGVSWYIDGVLQGTIDREADEFPAYWGLHSLTTNRISLASAHIYYAWDLRHLDQLTA